MKMMPHGFGKKGGCIGFWSWQGALVYGSTAICGTVVKGIDTYAFVSYVHMQFGNIHNSQGIQRNWYNTHVLAQATMGTNGGTWVYNRGVWGI